MLPVLLLSGILLPMTLAPAWLQTISDINPLKHVVSGKWETVELPVADFYRLISPGDRLQDGDRFSWLNFAVAPATGQFYFDDIELVEVQR